MCVFSFLCEVRKKRRRRRRRKRERVSLIHRNDGAARRVNQVMNEWMNEWMNERMNKWIQVPSPVYKCAVPFTLTNQLTIFLLLRWSTCNFYDATFSLLLSLARLPASGRLSERNSNKPDHESQLHCDGGHVNPLLPSQASRVSLLLLLCVFFVFLIHLTALHEWASSARTHHTHLYKCGDTASYNKKKYPSLKCVSEYFFAETASYWRASRCAFVTPLFN